MGSNPTPSSKWCHWCRGSACNSVKVKVSDRYRDDTLKNIDEWPEWRKVLAVNQVMLLKLHRGFESHLISKYSHVAQLVEHLSDTQKAMGSIPIVTTKIHLRPYRNWYWLPNPVVAGSNPVRCAKGR